MPSAEPPELPTQWRLPGSQRLFLLGPLMVLLFSGMASVHGLLQPVESRASHTFDWVLLAILALTAALALVTAFRTRVRILPEGLEVQELRSRVYAWPEIADVQLSRRPGSGRIRITLADERVRLLPAPVLSRRPSSGQQVAEALAGIEGRLLPDRPARVLDELTSLDDLLHE